MQEAFKENKKNGTVLKGGAIFVSIFLLLFGLLGILKLTGNTAEADSVHVILNVHVCNANAICELMIGENYGSCATDCPPPVTPTTTPTTTAPVTPSSSGGELAPQTGVGYTDQSHDSFPKGVRGEIKITPFKDHAVINFETYLPVLLSTSWGKTPTYEMGSSAETSYHHKFDIEISNLEPGTVYYFKIRLLDTLGRVVEYERYFTTLSIPNFTSLPTIRNLRIDQEGNTNDVMLSWEIPDLPVNQRVRLVRRMDTFSIEPMDGKVIYEGRGERVNDVGLIPKKKYYYSLFVVDKAGNYSAPAIVRFTLAEDNNPNPLPNRPDGYIEQESGLYDPLVNDPRPLYLQGEGKNGNHLGFCGDTTIFPVLSLMDSYVAPQNRQEGEGISFIQNGKNIESRNGVIRAKYEFPLVIKLSSKAVTDDRDRVGICLVSKVTGFETYHLFTKNLNGDFELVFPAEIKKDVEKKHYQFTLGVIKFSGQERAIERGEIAYILDTKEKNFIPVIIFIICFIFFIAIFGYVLTFRKRK